MPDDFLHTTLGKTGMPVFRLGFSASTRPGKHTVQRAIDDGANYLFWYGFDTHMTSALRELPASSRERLVIATGAYNLIWFRQDVRRTLEKRLRQIRTEYIDVYLFLGVMKPEQLPASVLDEMRRLREEGKVRAIAISTHDRRLAGRLVSEGALDVLMMRYNAAHPGAERDIFPYLAAHDPGVVSYTATRWTQLLRRPRGWPKNARIPDAGMCYRWVLSNPNVDVCLTAPSNLAQWEQNLAAARLGPLPDEDMQFMREFGAHVRRAAGWFMEPKGQPESTGSTPG